MRAVALRVVYIVSLLCLGFAAIGLLAWSPITLALGVTGWFLSRAAMRSLIYQGDVHAPTPHVQYWGRSLLLQTIALMILGAVIAAGGIYFDLDVPLSPSEETLLTVMLIAAMAGITRFALPGFFAASWELHGAPDRRQRNRSSMSYSRLIVRSVAFAVLISSVVGTYSLVKSYERLGSRTTSLMQLAKAATDIGL